MYTTRGHGLRGGSYTITGGYLSHSPLSIRFAGTRLVSDMAVSGRAVWYRRAWRVHARLRLSGAATGVLASPSRRTPHGAIATISGRVGRRTVHLETARALGTPGVARSSLILPAATRAKASGLVAVRSIAGSTVE